MGRNDYKTITLKLNKGLNEQGQDTDIDECSDCNNVWAPNGELETRPGFWPITQLGLDCAIYDGIAVHDMPTADYDLFVQNGTTGVITQGVVSAPLCWRFDLGTVPVNSIYYIGKSLETSTYLPDNPVCHFRVSASPQCTNLSNAIVEYYNGSTWKYLPHNRRNGSTQVGENIHLESEFTEFAYVPPVDMAEYTITVGAITATRLFVRVKIINAVNNGILEVALPGNTGYGAYQFSGLGVCVALVCAKLRNSRKFIVLYNNKTDPPGFTVRSSDAISFNSRDFVSTYSGNYPYRLNDIDSFSPPRISHATVRETGEVYFAFANKIIKYYQDTNMIDDNPSVESRDFAIGRGAPYDKTTIAQLAEFPKANIVKYINSRLWFANIRGEKDKVMWSAAFPYHGVIPSLNYTTISDIETSDVTAISQSGDSTIVFTATSLWKLSFATLDSFGNPQYLPRKIANIGTVSPDSVVSVGTSIMFLGSDSSIYTYDGSFAVVKATLDRNKLDKLIETSKEIKSSLLWQATATYWPSKKCYILAASTGTRYSDTIDMANATGLRMFSNDLLVVLDLRNGSIWKWTGKDNHGIAELNVVSFVVDTDTSGNDHVYFANRDCSVFEFGVGSNDYYDEIDSSITTQELLQEVKNSKVIREVSIISGNNGADITCNLLTDNGNNSYTNTFRFYSWRDCIFGIFTLGSRLLKWAYRTTRKSFNVTAKSFKLKLDSSDAGEKMFIAKVDIGINILGKR